MITATGPISTPKQRLRELVANSATFIARCGVANAAAALARVFPIDTVLEDASQVRPYAMVTIPDGSPIYGMLAGGSQNFLRLRDNQLSLAFCDNSRQSDQTDDAIDFENFVGGVLQEVAELAGSNQWLDIVDIQWENVPARTAETSVEAGKHWWLASVLVRWGVQD